MGPGMNLHIVDGTHSNTNNTNIPHKGDNPDSCPVQVVLSKLEQVNCLGYRPCG